MISKRAQNLLGPLPPIVEAHFRSYLDPYHAETRPQGYINLGTAENRLLWSLIEPWFRPDSKGIPESVSHYDYLHGTLRLRTAIARYLQDMTQGRTIDPETLIIGTGATSVLDNMVYTLCDPGDAVLLPAPYYSGFLGSISMRAGAVPIDIPLDPQEGYRLTPAKIETALAQCNSKKIKPRILLICNPHNPLGTVLTAQEVRELIEFTRARQLHVIFDELYAQSVFNNNTQFTSCLAYPAEEHVHMLSGFGKDFAIAGLKMGYFQSTNKQLLHACRNLSLFSTVSTLPQWYLAHLLEDLDAVKKVMTTYRERLAHACTKIRAGFESLGVPTIEPHGGFFVWADFRSKLSAQTFDAERMLWSRFFDEAKVNMTTGEAFHSPEPGWFRACFAQPDMTLDEAVRRLGKVL